MSVKRWFGVVLLFAMVGSAAGREPDVHVDLAASNAIPRFFAIPFVFEDGNLDCLEARWTMTVSNGLLHIRHLNLPPIEQPTYHIMPCSMRSCMRSESMSDTFSATTSETRNPAP
jgi:hypothetical protein